MQVSRVLCVLGVVSAAVLGCGGSDPCARADAENAQFNSGQAPGQVVASLHTSTIAALLGTYSTATGEFQLAAGGWSYPADCQPCAIVAYADDPQASVKVTFESEELESGWTLFAIVGHQRRPVAHFRRVAPDVIGAEFELSLHDSQLDATTTYESLATGRFTPPRLATPNSASVALSPGLERAALDRTLYEADQREYVKEVTIDDGHATVVTQSFEGPQCTPRSDTQRYVRTNAGYLFDGEATEVLTTILSLEPSYLLGMDRLHFRRVDGVWEGRLLVDGVSDESTLAGLSDEALRCFAPHRASAKGDGKIVMQWTVDAQGVAQRPKVVTDTLSSMKVSECIKARIEATPFAPTGSERVLRREFVFRP